MSRLRISDFPDSPGRTLLMELTEDAEEMAGGKEVLGAGVCSRQRDTMSTMPRAHSCAYCRQPYEQPPLECDQCGAPWERLQSEVDAELKLLEIQIQSTLATFSPDYFGRITETRPRFWRSFFGAGLV